MADAGHPGLDNHAQLQETLAEEWGAFAWQHDGAQAEDPAVTTFTQREIALALADWDCHETLDLVARSNEITHEHHQQFIDRHRSELETWVALAAELRGE